MSHDSRFTGKTILLTGATGGLGQALAKELADAGATLLLSGRDRSQLEQLSAKISGDHRYFAADTTATEQRAALIDWALSHDLDGVINNAGIGQLALVGEQSQQEIEKLIELNLTVPMLLCEALLESLKERQDAIIVNIGSILGSIGVPGSALYGASKAGLQRYTESLRRELSDSSVCVFYCAPRAVATAFNSEATVTMNSELGNRADLPTDVAVAILKRCQKKAGSYYLGWPEKLFVRVNAVLPKLVDSAMNKQLASIKRFAKRV